MSAALTRGSNLQGAVLMVLSMAGFAIEDMFIKLMAGTLPVGQILLLLGVGGALVFGALSLARGDRLWSADLRHPAVIGRTLGEMIGTVGFITAIALTPISTASAIIQAMPLAVTLGAALFLGEKVGWRRWSAIGVGFFGVLLVIQPGSDGFSILSLFAVIGVIGLATRDVSTRLVPGSISSVQLSTYAFVALIPTGAAMMFVEGRTWVAPDAQAWAWLFGAQLTGVFAYGAIVAATRMGDVSVIAPFRYARIIFALCVGALVFGERPDLLTLAGAAIIVGSGLYTLLRQAQLQRRGRNAAASLSGGPAL